MEHLAIKTLVLSKVFFCLNSLERFAAASKPRDWLCVLLHALNLIPFYTVLTVVHCSFVKLTEVDGGWIRLVS